MDQHGWYAIKSNQTKPNKWLMLNWIVRNRTVWLFNCVYLQSVFTNHKSYIRYICKNWIWHWITNNVWYAIKPNQTYLILIIYIWLYDYK